MVEPAMTKEEWAAGRCRDIVTDGERVVFEQGPIMEWDRHALAAVCLHGQPFGFTREDIQAIRVLMECIPGDWGAIPKGTMDAWDKAQQLAPDLAERIAALLPPEK